MNEEQSCLAIVSLKSMGLVEIFKKKELILSSFGNSIKINYGQIDIEAKDDFNFVDLPQNRKQVIKKICFLLKNYIGKDSKVIIKDIIKNKKNISDEILCDWLYVETCTGELAKEMFKIKNSTVNLEEELKIDKYVFEFSFKNDAYFEKEYAIYKEN